MMLPALAMASVTLSAMTEDGGDKPVDLNRLFKVSLALGRPEVLGQALASLDEERMLAAIRSILDAMNDIVNPKMDSTGYREHGISAVFVVTDDETQRFLLDVIRCFWRESPMTEAERHREFLSFESKLGLPEKFLVRLAVGPLLVNTDEDKDVMDERGERIDLYFSRLRQSRTITVLGKDHLPGNLPDSFLDIVRWGGELPQLTSPGGYTIQYLADNSDPLCAACATLHLIGEISCERLDYGLYDEGPPFECEHCYKSIESSYGDPDEGKADEPSEEEEPEPSEEEESEDD